MGTPNRRRRHHAYGNTVVASYGYADDNLIRFSTRPIDPLRLLGHWTMRVNDFERGRWGSRDPFAEAGDIALLWRHARNTAQRRRIARHWLRSWFGGLGK